MTKGYIFDYGGTLDTGGCHWGKVLWHAYERQEASISEELFRRAYVYAERAMDSSGLVGSTFTFRQTMACKVGLQMDFLLAHDAWQAGGGQAAAHLKEAVVEEVCAVATRHTRHSVEVLRRLRQRGLPLAVVSNFYGNLPTVLAEHGFGGLFSGVVESARVGLRKPDPRIFALGIEALGLQPDEVTVVGDSIGNDILPARQAGCHTVWLEGEQWTAGAPDRTKPHRIITDLVQLL